MRISLPALPMHWYIFVAMVATYNYRGSTVLQCIINEQALELQCTGVFMCSTGVLPKSQPLVPSLFLWLGIISGFPFFEALHQVLLYASMLIQGIISITQVAIASTPQLELLLCRLTSIMLIVRVDKVQIRLIMRSGLWSDLGQMKPMVCMCAGIIILPHIESIYIYNVSS